MKAGNTLDTLITENGRNVVRHYLQDVGSGFGTGANGPHEFFEGWEHLVEGRLALARLISLGFFLQPAQTVDYPKHEAIGRFEGNAFDPLRWKPRVATAAFLQAGPDDTFWAARRVTAFSDQMIRSIAATGQYSDPASAQYLADVLISRRDAIGRTYLTGINPVVDPALDNTGVLTFRNTAVDSGFARAPAGYRAVWSILDNTTGTNRPLSETSSPSTTLRAPSDIPQTPGAYLQVALSASGAPSPSWERAAHAYFRRVDRGWRLVGFERLPKN
jgi:hypothetical protein